MNGKTSKPLANNSGVLPGVRLSQKLFSACTGDLQSSSHYYLFKFGDVPFSQAFVSNDGLYKFFKNVPTVCRFSERASEKPNKSNHFEQLLSRPANPFELSFPNSKIRTRIDSMKYLGAIIDENLKWASHIFTSVKNFRRLSHQIVKFRHYKLNRTIIFGVCVKVI